MTSDSNEIPSPEEDEPGIELLPDLTSSVSADELVEEADEIVTEAGDLEIDDARSRLAEAYAKYEKALSAASPKDRSGILNNWGLALVEEGKRLEGEERSELFDQALANKTRPGKSPTSHAPLARWAAVALL